MSRFIENVLLGGYSSEVPPLPIPNREVKLTNADGTAVLPWEEFQAHVKKDSWANPENVTPLVIDDISKMFAVRRTNER